MSPPFVKGGQGGLGDEIKVMAKKRLFVTRNRHIFIQVDRAYGFLPSPIASMNSCRAARSSARYFANSALPIQRSS